MKLKLKSARDRNVRKEASSHNERVKTKPTRPWMLLDLSIEYRVSQLKLT
jgi:hypothetical protein